MRLEGRRYAHASVISTLDRRIRNWARECAAHLAQRRLWASLQAAPRSAPSPRAAPRPAPARWRRLALLGRLPSLHCERG